MVYCEKKNVSNLMHCGIEKKPDVLWDTFCAFYNPAMHQICNILLFAINRITMITNLHFNFFGPAFPAISFIHVLVPLSQLGVVDKQCLGCDLSYMFLSGEKKSFQENTILTTRKE